MGLTEDDAAIIQDELATAARPSARRASSAASRTTSWGVTGYGVAEAADAARAARPARSRRHPGLRRRRRRRGATARRARRDRRRRVEPRRRRARSRRPRRRRAARGARRARRRGSCAGDLRPGDELDIAADVLIPAATQDVDRRSSARADLRFDVIVEGANLPIRPDALEVLARARRHRRARLHRQRRRRDRRRVRDGRPPLAVPDRSRRDLRRRLPEDARQHRDRARGAPRPPARPATTPPARSPPSASAPRCGSRGGSRSTRCDRPDRRAARRRRRRATCSPTPTCAPPTSATGPGASAAPALAVVRPADTAQVRRGAARCARHGVRRSSRRAATPASSAAACRAAARSLLSLARWPTIGRSTARCAGPRRRRRDARARCTRRPRRPGSRPGSTSARATRPRIGGIVACNAGGARALRYGTTRAQRRRPRGGARRRHDHQPPVRLGQGQRRASTSPQLLVGCEGTLGDHHPRACWRLVPQLHRAWPRSSRCRTSRPPERLLAALHDARARARGVRAATPTALELVAAAPAARVAGRGPRRTTCSPSSPRTETRPRARRGVRAPASSDGAVADDTAARERLWALREAPTEASPPSASRTSSTSACRSPSWPRSSPSVRAWSPRRTRRALIVFGHLGDGNLHVNVLGPDARRRRRRRRRARARARLRRQDQRRARHRHGQGALARARPRGRVRHLARLEAVAGPGTTSKPPGSAWGIPKQHGLPMRSRRADHGSTHWSEGGTMRSMKVAAVGCLLVMGVAACGEDDGGGGGASQGSIRAQDAEDLLVAAAAGRFTRAGRGRGGRRDARARTGRREGRHAHGRVRVARRLDRTGRPWTPEAESANALKASQDDATAIYLGTLNSAPRRSRSRSSTRRRSR